MKKRDRADSYLIRLFNGSADAKKTTLTVGDISLLLNFGRYEVETVEYRDGILTELDRLII